MTREEEERLVRRIKEGHIEAFAPLVEHYKRSIYVLVLRIVEQREEAEEVAQDVFLKAFQAIHSFDHRSRFSTWLYRIACNTALSTVRSRKRPFRLLGGARAEQITETLVEEDTAEPIMLNEAQTEALWRAMDRLPAEERALIQLHYYEELPLAACGEVLHQTENSIKVRIHRIRKKLAIWINEEV